MNKLYNNFKSTNPNIEPQLNVIVYQYFKQDGSSGLANDQQAAAIDQSQYLQRGPGLLNLLFL